MAAAAPASTVPGMVIATAQNYGVDPALALEVASVESGFSPSAVSSAGAIGVMQVMPATAAGFGVSAADLYDPQTNINTGMAYLAGLLAEFGDPTAALAAYNWGPSNVQTLQAAYGANWFAYAPSSVQAYVNQILLNVGTQYTVTAAPAAASLTLELPSSTALLNWNTILVALAVIVGVGFILQEE